MTSEGSNSSSVCVVSDVLDFSVSPSSLEPTEKRRRQRCENLVLPRQRLLLRLGDSETSSFQDICQDVFDIPFIAALHHYIVGFLQTVLA
jgi:hypothetical protein